MSRDCRDSRAVRIVLAVVLVGLGWCPSGVLAQIKYHPAAEQVPSEPPPEQATWGSLRIGGLGQDVDGNRSRFTQYYTPPTSAYPSLELHNISGGGETVSWLRLQDISEPGRQVDVAVDDLKSLMDFDARWRHDEFSESFSSPSGLMERDDFQMQLGVPVCRRLELDIDTGYVALDGESNLGPVDWRAFDVESRAYWSGDRVAVDAGLDVESFRQLGPGTEVSGTDRVVSLGVGPSGNHRHVLEAFAQLQNTQLDGFGMDFEREAVGASLSSELRPDLTFYGRFTTEETDETITQNSYALSRTAGRASLLYTGLQRASIEGGAEFSETQYVERFQSAIDEPDTTTAWVRARYRPWPEVRLTGTFIRRDIDETPLRSLGDGGQGPIVVYDESQQARVQGSYSICARAGVSGQWRRDEWRLDPEGVETSLDSVSATAWAVPWERLTVTGSYVNQRWGIGGVDGAGQRAADWVTKLNAYTVGAVLQMGGDSWLDGSFTHAYSYGAVMTRDNTATASWRRRLGEGTHIGLSVTFEDFNEAIEGNANDFDATLIGGTVVHSF